MNGQEAIPIVRMTGGVAPGGGGGGGAVTIADGDDVAQGATTDAEAAAGNGTVIGLLKRHRTLLGTIIVLLGAGLPATLVSDRLKTNTVAATATAAAPTYGEGDDVKLSVDLAGTLRTTAGGGGGNPTAGRLDSLRRLDTLRYVAAGRLDSVRRVDVLQSLFATNAIGAGAIEQPLNRATAAVPVRTVLENFSGGYSFSLVDQAGVAAANNFLCLFNLSGSNDTVVVIAAWVNTYSVAASTAKNSLRLTRVTTCTVGTLQGATAINKYATGYPNATSEIRTGNPTVTAAAEVIAWAPNAVITAAGTTAAGMWEWAPIERMQLAPGEGVVFRQTVAGDVDQTYDIRIAWAERQH